MKKILAGAAVLAAVAAAGIFYLPALLVSYDQEQEIADASHPIVLELAAPQGMDVEALYVRIEGKLEGPGMRVKQAYPAGEERLHDLGTGSIKRSFGGKWFAEKCLLLFEPKGRSSGNLKVKYRFKGK